MKHSTHQLLFVFLLIASSVLTVVCPTKSYAQDFEAVERRLGSAVAEGELTMEQAMAMLRTLRELKTVKANDTPTIPKTTLTLELKEFQKELERLATERTNLVLKYGQGHPKVLAKELAISSKINKLKEKTPNKKLPKELYKAPAEEPLFSNQISLMKNRAERSLIAAGMDPDMVDSAMKVVREIKNGANDPKTIGKPIPYAQVASIARKVNYQGKHYDLLIGIGRRLARLQLVLDGKLLEPTRMEFKNNKPATQKLDRQRQLLVFQKEWRTELEKKIRDLGAEKSELIETYGTDLPRVATIETQLAHYRILYSQVNQKVEELDKIVNRSIRFHKMQFAPAE